MLREYFEELWFGSDRIDITVTNATKGVHKGKGFNLGWYYEGTDAEADAGAHFISIEEAVDLLGTQNRGSGWLETTADVFSVAGISGTAKTKLIDFAVRDYAGLSRKSFNQLSNYSKTVSEVRALGAAGAKYLRYTKGVGVLGNVVGVTSAGVQLIQNPTAGNATRLAVQGAAIGAAFIPVVGWAVSLGIGVADLIWGDDFYNWIDKH